MPRGKKTGQGKKASTGPARSPTPPVSEEAPAEVPAEVPAGRGLPDPVSLNASFGSLLNQTRDSQGNVVDQVLDDQQPDQQSDASSDQPPSDDQ